MSLSDNKKQGVFREFHQELKHIFLDTLFMYRHFIHWNVSKALIFMWSMILGIILMIPVFLIACVIGLIDPIAWIELAGTTLSGQDPSLELIASLAEHPYWLGFMVFLAGTGFLFFLLGSSYWLLLMFRLSLKYTERKKLSFKKNFYFSQKHIRAFLTLTTLNFVIFLAPIFITVFCVATIRLLGLSGSIFDWSTIIMVLLCIGTIIYLLYNILFGYVILADQKRSDAVHSGRAYIKSSTTLTTGKNIWKFLFLFAMYILLMTPFNNYEIYLEKQMQYMGSALAYKTGEISSIDDSERKYYEYVSAQYSEMSNIELQEKIIGVSRARMLYAVILYFVFGGLGVMLLTSFYKRILLKK